MKRMVVGAVAGLLLVAGCGKVTGPLSCEMSAQEACAMALSLPCDSTWTETQTDPRLCLPGIAGAGRSTTYDCGGYHVIHELSIGANLDVYYDVIGGAPVALVGYTNGVPTCYGGPSAGFTLPSGCTDPATAPPLPQCRPDAGAQDGAQD